MPMLGTFHSYVCICYENMDLLLDLIHFLFRYHDKEQLLKSIIKRLGSARGITPHSAASLISQQKNDITQRTSTVIAAIGSHAS